MRVTAKSDASAAGDGCRRVVKGLTTRPCRRCRPWPMLLPPPPAVCGSIRGALHLLGWPYCQLQEFQAKDPAVTPETARWSATELDDKVKSVGWGQAYIHLLLEAFQANSKYIYGKDWCRLLRVWLARSTTQPGPPFPSPPFPFKHIDR